MINNKEKEILGKYQFWKNIFKNKDPNKILGEFSQCNGCTGCGGCSYSWKVHCNYCGCSGCGSCS